MPENGQSPIARDFKSVLLICIALTLITLITFRPLFHAQFAEWDDRSNLSGNQELMNRSGQGLAYFWAHPYLQLYIPVTYTAWWILVIAQPAQDGALDPAPFHIANVLVHAATVLIIFAILRLLVTNNWAAAAGALIFAIHPLQVEAVGWVSGLKDLLAGFFGFAAIWCYLIHIYRPRLPQLRRGRSLHFAIATLALVIAMLSKPGAMVIPFIAMAIAILSLRRPIGRTLVELSVWLCIAAAAAIVARVVQPASDTRVQIPIWARPLVVGDSAAFYLAKLFLPIQLEVDYGRNLHDLLYQFPHAGYWAWFFPVIVFTTIWFCRRRWPFLLPAAAIFVAGLSPILGLASFSYQSYSTVADHYVYPAMLGPALAVAGLLASVRRTALAASIFLPISFLLCVLSFQQAGTWISDSTIFTHMFQVSPHNWLARNHLWLVAMSSHNYSEAEAQARAFIKEYPDHALAYFDLGESLVYQNRRTEAADAYRAEIRVDPNQPSAYNDLAALYAEDGRFDLAIPLYERALQLNPDYNDAQIGLARARREAATRASATRTSAPGEQP